MPASISTDVNQVRSIGDVLNWGSSMLAGLEHPWAEAEMLLAEGLQLPRTHLYLNVQGAIPEPALEKVKNWILRRSRHEPLAYISGRAPFMGLEFDVNPDVLIPRPETELLVETCLELIKEKTDARLLDVGTGSGCIAIALARVHEQRRVIALDLSDKALTVARGNALRLEVGQQIAFFQSDIYAGLGKEFWGYFDMIVSNPPYISSRDWMGLPPDLSYEPSLALKGGVDGLDIVRKVVSEAPRYLKKGGRLGLEVGAGQRPAVTELLTRAGFKNTEWKKDFQNWDRVVTGVHSGAI